MVTPALSDPSPSPTRAFGRFELRSLLGKSARTMVWLVRERLAGIELMLTMPREAPANAGALARWIERARHAARLDHPNLTRVVDIGTHEHWPFVVVERASGVTLQEWMAEHPKAPTTELAGWLGDALNGLAFAHEAGISHGDPQLHHVLINEHGTASIMGLGAIDALHSTPARRTGTGRGLAVDTELLRDQRAAAERDVLACGILLHHLVVGEPALGIADTGRVMECIAPHGREVLRLGWTTPLPVPEALRAIANRATSSQERLRYRNARTLLGALTGWLTSYVEDSGGPVAVLIDRLHSVGHLPALPGLGLRVARITALEKQRTDEIASQILPDMALSFELLRTLNSATVQGTQVPGNGPVLTLRRVVELIGMDGLRTAANTLRTWPGPLDETGAARLKQTMDTVRFAGHVAQALRPAGYDPHVVFLITVMQNLGRLMVRYHFAEEAEQIEQLMQPGAEPPADDPRAARPPGMTEQAAAMTVLGVEVEALGSAVAHHWGLGDEVLHMIRRLHADTPVHRPDTDADLLRILASAANEAVDAVTRVAPPRVAAALDRVVDRYGRALRFGTRAMNEALAEGREAVRKGAPVIPQRSSAETATDARPTEPSAPAELTD